MTARWRAPRGQLVVWLGIGLWPVAMGAQQTTSGGGDRTGRGGGVRSAADSAEALTSRARPRYLVLELAVGSSYEDNVRFLQAPLPNDPRRLDDQYRQASAAVRAGATGPRGGVRVDVRGDAARFAALRELDRETFDVDVQLSRRWTPRVTSLTDVRSLRATGVMGVASAAAAGLLPLTLTRTESAVQSLAMQASPRTNVVATVDASRVRFDEASLEGGTTMAAQLQVQHQLSPRASLATRSEVRRVAFGGAPIGTVLGDVAWQRRVGNARWTVQAGATAMAPRGFASGAWNDSVRVEPTGSVSVEHGVGRTSATVRAGREANAGFGFGRVLLTESVTAAITRQIGRQGRLALAVDASQNRDALVDGLSVRFTSIMADWTIPMGPAAVAASAFARRRTDGLAVRNVGGSLQMRIAVGRAP